MKLLIAITMFASLLSLEVFSSAQEQSPAPVPAPSNASSPSAQTQTEPTPAAPPTPSASGSEAQTAAPAAANPPNQALNSVQKKPAAKVSATAHKKVVVRNGGAKDESAQLAPDLTHEQELRNRQATAHLLDTTNANLKSIAGHQLTPSQQSMLEQVHAYMRQSKEASNSGDLARAHTLAYKARLLSDELARK